MSNTFQSILVYTTELVKLSLILKKNNELRIFKLELQILIKIIPH